MSEFSRSIKLSAEENWALNGQPEEAFLPVSTFGNIYLDAVTKLQDEESRLSEVDPGDPISPELRMYKIQKLHELVGFTEGDVCETIGDEAEDYLAQMNAPMPEVSTSEQSERGLDNRRNISPAFRDYPPRI